nr:hypothetical protein [Enterovibrio nigricans]
MRYTKEWKPRFRLWEVRFIGGKQLFSFALLTFLTALTPRVAFADDGQNLDAKSLESWVLHAYKGELESIAQSQHWPAYSVDASIRIPPSVVHLSICKSPMIIEGRDHQSLPIGNLKRAISCNDLTSPWRINVSIKSTVTLPIVFVNESIQRGETLKPSACR